MSGFSSRLARLMGKRTSKGTGKPPDAPTVHEEDDQAAPDPGAFVKGPGPLPSCPGSDEKDEKAASGPSAAPVERTRDRRHSHMLEKTLPESKHGKWVCSGCKRPGEGECFHCRTPKCSFFLHDECVLEVQREVFDCRHLHVLFYFSLFWECEGAKKQKCAGCKKGGAEGWKHGSYRCVPCGLFMHPACVQQDKRRDALVTTTPFEVPLLLAHPAAEPVYQAHGYRSLDAGEDAKVIKAYVEQRDKKKALACETLSAVETGKKAAKDREVVPRLPQPLIDIVLEYCEEDHCIYLERVGGDLPLRFTLEDGTQAMARESKYAEWAGLGDFLQLERARFEFAKMLAAPVRTVRLFDRERKAEITERRTIIARPVPMILGRPFVAERQPPVSMSSHKANADDSERASLVCLELPVETSTSQAHSYVLSSLLAAPEADDWSAFPIPCSGRALPSLNGLTEETKGKLSVRWSEAGLAEHASVASFSRFSLQLMAAGAPPDLLFDAQRAAADEVRHARICFSLSRFYSGGRKPVEPSDFPLSPSISIPSDLASLASSTAAEACFEETLSCLALAEQAERCTDPVVRKCLMSIARDEARHARLAWRTLQWALRKARRRGSEEASRVSAAVARAFQQAAQKEPAAEVAEEMKGEDVSDEEKGLEEHGLLPRRVEKQLRAVAERSLVTVWAARVLTGEGQDQQQEQGQGQEREGVTAASDADALLSAGFMGAGALAASIRF